jgi:hypothetical protein
MGGEKFGVSGKKRSTLFRLGCTHRLLGSTDERAGCANVSRIIITERQRD